MSAQLCLKMARAGLWFVVGALILTAMGGTASAGFIPIDPVPEIDPTSIASAVTLFMGSVILLTGRRKHK